jgi:DNA-directed RNA polymerase I subunit RPA2
VRATVTLRYNRNPVIGDKFSSRHGQKGVLSFLWPEEDMPFSDRTGIRPDIIINPHAFPSRMTIGMLVESLAAKAGALEGTFVDATPFARTDQVTSPVTLYGNILRGEGYSHCGSERLVNGCTGESFSVDIYIGVVYYQRLRHMVRVFSSCLMSFCLTFF